MTTLLLDDDGRDDLIDAMADVSADLVPAVKERSHARVEELLLPYGLIPLRALAIAQAARIHVLEDGRPSRRRRDPGADEAPADPIRPESESSAR